MSKGDYVTFLDADDGLCNINILQKAYDIATKEKGEKIIWYIIKHMELL